MIGLIFSELDETVVNTAMPTIVRELNGLSLYGWVAGVYMLAMTAFIPILGKLADLYGRKRVYITSICLFILGSLVSGSAHSMIVLLVGRGIQGVGAGGLMPIAMMIFGDVLSVQERSKVQGIFGAIMFIPQLAGPLIGGYFTQHMSWHWIFWINIPVGVLAAIILSTALQESKGSERASIDWTGAFFLVGSIVSLLLTPVLHENAGYAWNSTIIIGLLALGTLLLGALIYIETKVKEPILPLPLFRNRTFVVLSFIIFTMMMSIMGAVAMFQLFAQNVLGLTPIEAGYLTLPVMVGGILSSVVAGRLLTKFPYRYIFIASMILPILAFYLMTHIDAHTKVLVIIGYLAILGPGFGVLFNNNLIVQESVPKERSGIAQSTITLFQSIGMTIGLSIYGSLFASQVSTKLTSLAGHLSATNATAVAQAAKGGIPTWLSPQLVEQVKTVLAGAFQHLYWISLALAIVVFALCWLMKTEVLKTRSEETAEEELSA